MYVVKFDNGTYLTKNGSTRVFGRKCDASNAVNQYKYRYRQCLGHQILPCKIIIDEPKKYFKVDRKLPNFYICKDGSHFQSKIFDNLDDANTYLQESCHSCSLHHDYFTLTEATEEEYKRWNYPNWENYFLGIAKVVSQRSKDVQTKHGCVIVDGSTNRILGTGYNSFPRGMNDTTLPNTRPDKYTWMIHSEVNAVSNMIVKADEMTVAYVTGECCNNCLMHMWQNGITKVVQQKALGSALLNEETRKIRERFLKDTHMRVTFVEPNLTWLKQINV